MNCIKINAKIQSLLHTLLLRDPIIIEIVDAIHAAGGRALLVGGAVRDLILDRPVKDFDCEVHGISLKSLEVILNGFGRVNLIGKSFGVLRVNCLDVDWSLPRIDDAGRKPTVHLNANLSIENAFMRRDLTINAMGIDLHTNTLIDPFDGMSDLTTKTLRAPNIDLFLHDPLRFFRVMQFIGRFDMYPDSALNECCKNMSLDGISKERISLEFEKLLLLSRAPSLGIRWLKSIGRLKDLLPELDATSDVPQDPDWHPEGNVFEHSMQTLDAASCILYTSNYDMLALRYAALCHDLGKVNTTKKVNGRWHSFGHAQTGAKFARAVLKRIVIKKNLIYDVSVLVEHHMAAGTIALQQVGLVRYKRLALKLVPRMNLHILADLALADSQGRNNASNIPLTKVPEWVLLFKDTAKKAGVLFHPEAPLLRGKDLMGVLAPGPAFGLLLHKAYQLQIDEQIADKEELKRRIFTKGIL